MKNNNLSKNNLSKMCGVSIGVLDRLLKGNVNVRLTNVVKICRSLKLKFNDVFEIIY